MEWHWQAEIKALRVDKCNDNEWRECKLKRQWNTINISAIVVSWGVGKCPPNISLPKNSFLATELHRANKKFLWPGGRGGNGCMYSKSWFKPIFSLFLTWLLRILTFENLAVYLRTIRFKDSKILHGVRFALSFLYGPQNRQRPLLYTSLTFRNRASYIYDGHTATLQTPHFIYFFNKYTYWIFLNMLHTLSFFLFKMPFIS